MGSRGSDMVVSVYLVDNALLDMEHDCVTVWYCWVDIIVIIECFQGQWIAGSFVPWTHYRVMLIKTVLGVKLYQQIVVCVWVCVRTRMRACVCVCVCVIFTSSIFAISAVEMSSRSVRWDFSCSSSPWAISARPIGLKKEPKIKNK